MRYFGVPYALWLLYVNSFKKQLKAVLKYDDETVKQIMAKSKKKYKEILVRIPEFEKEDEFNTNIISCTMFSAVLLNLPDQPTIDKLTEFYSAAMMIAPTKLLCRMDGKEKFTQKDILKRKKTAALKAGTRNPYSWNMEFLPYSDNSGYECRFSQCGICTLMNELNLHKYIPAMCHLDYDMNTEGGAVDFVRQYTLASGGPYCDCGYKKKVLYVK